jgi:uncharacterized protein (TIGR00661 family)
VRFVSSTKTNDYLREHFPGRVHEVFGLYTVYNQGKAEPLKTVWHNIRRAIQYVRPSRAGIRGLIREFKPDLIVTDFEPFAAFWARLLGIPYISLDNQHLLTHCELEHPPGFSRDLLNAYVTIRFYYAGAQRYLIPSFYEAPIRYQPARLIPPILRPSVYRTEPRDDGFLLAYKGAGGENDAMRMALEQYDRLPVRAYGFGVSGQRGHVTFKDTNGEGFLADLASCRAVVSTAGHSLVCESLYFGKPMLLIPVQQQYEQVLNAHHVERIAAGRSCSCLEPRLIDEFLSGKDRFAAAIGSLPRASLDAVIQSVEDEIP